MSVNVFNPIEKKLDNVVVGSRRKRVKKTLFLSSNYFLFILFFLQPSFLLLCLLCVVVMESEWVRGSSESEKKLLFKFFTVLCSVYAIRGKLITRRYFCAFILSSWDRCLSVERNELKEKRRRERSSRLHTLQSEWKFIS